MTDARGRRGGGLALGGGGAIGIVGVLVYLAISLLSGGGGLGDLGALDNVAVGKGNVPGTLAQDCRTGEDANQREDCRIVAVVNSVQSFWTGAFERSNRRYVPVDTVFFTGSTQTGCGYATSAVGPFYCPADKLVYIDLGFFDDVKSQLGVEVTPFVQAYVIAHEYGHHVQDLLGVSSEVSRLQQQHPDLANQYSVALELQADCYAGVWAAHAVDTALIEEVTAADIKDGLDAAAAVGDDRIQQAATGRVDRESWTHGSSAQRQHWFREGYDTGDPRRCDTFASDAL